MALQKPNNPGVMIPVSAEIAVAGRWSETLQNIGFYKNPGIAIAGETIDDVYANGKLKKVKDGDKLTINFDLHENSLAVFRSLQKGLIEVKKELASVTGRIETYKPGQWGFNDDILLDKASANGNAIVPTTVEALIAGSWTSLVSGTDYNAGATSDGDTYIKFISGGLLNADAPTSSSIRVTYSATTDENLIYINHKASSLAEGFVASITWSWEYDGVKKEVKYLLENCLAEKAVPNPISDDDNTTMGTPVTFTGVVKKNTYKGFTLPA